MRVLLVRPRATGGLAAHVDQELALLRQHGADIREADVRIRERPRPLADLRTVRALRAEARALRPVSVHAHGLRAGALAALALGRRPRSGSEQRLVVTLHNRTVGSAPARAVGALLLRLLAARADIVLAVSPDLAEDARRAGAPVVRHAVVPAPGGDAPGGDAPGPASVMENAAAASPPDGRDAPRSPERPDGPDAPDATGALEVLVVARLAPQKGLEDLFDALALLRERELPLRVRIAGEGPLREALAERIRAERLPVELLGWRTDTAELLVAADLVVSAARWEGQPVALQEALRAGRAIVATDAGGTRWVTGEAAALVPVGDAPALAAAVAELADPDRRREAERASRARAAELPTADDMAEQLLGLLVVRPARW
ncbi:glycosyltransferase [Brachybacterium sp. DNPG3]